MKAKYERAIFIISVGLLALTIWFMVLCQGSSRPFGDGTLVDNGLLATIPRYELRFEEFSLVQTPQTYRYRFPPLPRVPVNLRLYPQIALAPTSSHCFRDCPAYKALEQTKTRVRVTLSKNQKVHFYTLKEPLTGVRGGVWGLSNNNFSNKELSDLDLSQKGKYELKLEVKSEQPPSLEMKFQPVLQWGGITLP